MTDQTDIERSNVSMLDLQDDLRQELEGLSLQLAEKQLINKGILEVPSMGKDEKNGRLVVSSLTKSYGRKTVVNNLNLTFYQNEVLVLLGHNGAGKTTTLNMLTGLTKPNSGSAVAYNIQASQVDLFTDYQNIADFIGLCP